MSTSMLLIDNGHVSREQGHALSFLFGWVEAETKAQEPYY